VELEASLSWLALTLTPGIAARLSARLLREYGSPEAVFRAPLTGIEACNVPAPAAQAIFKKQMFWRAEKEVDALREGRREAGELEGARVPASAAPDLRPAGDVVCARRRANPEFAELEHCRDSAAHSLWLANGGKDGEGPGGPRVDHCERFGARD